VHELGHVLDGYTLFCRLFGCRSSDIKTKIKSLEELDGYYPKSRKVSEYASKWGNKFKDFAEAVAAYLYPNYPDYAGLDGYAKTQSTGTL